MRAAIFGPRLGLRKRARQEATGALGPAAVPKRQILRHRSGGSPPAGHQPDQTLDLRVAQTQAGVYYLWREGSVGPFLVYLAGLAGVI